MGGVADASEGGGSDDRPGTSGPDAPGACASGGDLLKMERTCGSPVGMTGAMLGGFGLRARAATRRCRGVRSLLRADAA